MLFEVELSTVGGRAVLRVRGELDLATAPELARAVQAQLSTSPSSLVIDLTDTTFLDSSGARQLALAARQAGGSGTVLHLLCPPDNRPVQLVLGLLGMGAVVPVLDPATFDWSRAGS